MAEPASDLLQAKREVTALVPLTQLALELGVNRSSARKIAQKLGVVPVRRQMLDLGHRQRTLCWTREQADAILVARLQQGFEAPGRATRGLQAWLP